VIQRRSVVCFDTIFGRIELGSPYLWDKGKGNRPLTDDMKIAHHGRSEAVNRALSDFGGEESFGQAAGRFKEHHRYECSAGTVSRVAKEIAEEASEYTEKRLSEAGERYGESSEDGKYMGKLLIGSDGCELGTAISEPLKESEGDRHRKRKIINRREVRIGLTRDLGCVSKTYVGRMGSYPEVVRQSSDASVFIGMAPETEVIGMADGGMGLEEESENRFPNVRFVSDKKHLKDHLYETAEALGEKDGKSWVAGRLEAISAGDVGRMKKEPESHHRKTPNNRLKRLIGYIGRFCDCVNHDRFEEKGYPVGSGEVGSAHRSVPQKRLEIPGACRHPDSINHKLALRVSRADDRWEDFRNGRIQAKLAA
jgi:hypothetical protein